MHEHEIRIPLLQSFHGARPTVRRAVVDDPEHAAGVPIGRTCHDLLDQTVEGGYPGSGLAASKESGLMHIQGGQVGPGTGALILMFDLHHRPDPWRLRRMAAAPRLNARLLIGGDHEVVRGQGLLLPNALVEIENPTGLGRKLRIARKDPAAVEPRANRVVVQPAPDRAAADRRHQPAPLGFGGQLAQAPAGQRALGAGRQLTREGFDGNDDLGGKKPGGRPERE